MPEGTVVFYNQDRQFGFIKPDSAAESRPNVPGKIFFHYSKGSLGHCARKVTVPVPSKGDTVRYAVDSSNESRTTWWEFTDIKERLNTLTPAQLELVQRVLGPYANEWDIWNAAEELEKDRHFKGREWFGAYHKGPGPRGTFSQVLLWARYYLAERGITKPALPRWPDMPRYSVRVKAGGQWNAINVPWYTRVQADAFERHLREEGRYDGVRVVDLWPAAPPLSVEEAAKVLAECQRDTLKDPSFSDSEVSWYDDKWGQLVEIASAYFGTNHSWVVLDGHKYEGSEARRLKECGQILRVAYN